MGAPPKAGGEPNAGAAPKAGAVPNAVPVVFCGVLNELNRPPPWAADGVVDVAEPNKFPLGAGDNDDDVEPKRPPVG